MISYEANAVNVCKSNHSFPGTQEITPTTSVISMNEAFICEDDDSRPPKLASESYKQAVQSGVDGMISMSAKSEVAEVGASNQVLGFKRQEAKFYVQQVLTDLIALGVLEYDSGFENAINKTFKVNGL